MIMKLLLSITTGLILYKIFKDQSKYNKKKKRRKRRKRVRWKDEYNMPLCEYYPKKKLG